MGKSIRSKIKRQHRAEFRRTHGNDAFQANMEIVQAKLKECVKKQTMTSDGLERLSDMLATDNEPENVTPVAMDDGDSKGAPAIDALETTGAVQGVDERGENKATVNKKSRKKKYALRRAIDRTRAVDGPKEAKTYRYHCEF